LYVALRWENKRLCGAPNPGRNKAKRFAKHTVVLALMHLFQALFLTPAAKKTKTQAKNSSKKLNHREALSSF